MRLECSTPSQPIPQNARRLLGQLTGVIPNIYCYLPDRTDPTVFYATTVDPDLTSLVATSPAPLDAGGTGLSFEAALMRAIGEAAERYCLFFPDRERFIEGPYRDISQSMDVLDFQYLSVFTEAQYRDAGFEPLQRSTTVQWQPVTDLLTGTEALVPAHRVWMGMGAIENQVYYPTTSNGVACGETRAAALYRALLEYIERDAIMRTWYSKEPPRQIDLPADSRMHELITRRFETDYREIRFFEIDTVIGLPVVGCLAVDRRDRTPKFTIGGDCAFDRETAYIGAVLETAQTWVYLKDLLARAEYPQDLDPTQIYNLRDNLIYYAQPANYPCVEFFTEGNRETVSTLSGGPTDPSTALAELLDRCDQQGLTPYAIDVTTRDIREVGFTVVRALIPELVDLALPSLPPKTHPAVEHLNPSTIAHPYP